ncbi:MAG: hypothetical protein BMS9Abin31_0494 [Gammaproteobacteria bacterium]|nr:MAG: hypothetical protein BMS9Abin31_0494 [Gammaproteobacteria bacterium]
MTALQRLKWILLFKWYTGIIGGSRSLDFQAFSVFCIYVESNLGLFEAYLHGYYDVVLTVFVGINVALRFITTTKLGEKKNAG